MLNFDEMDNGTKLRTVLAVLTSINTALIATDLTGFENPTVNMIYKVVSIIINFLIVALNTYSNNDYTHEAQMGTQATRLMKADPSIVLDLYDGDDDGDDEDDEDETLPDEDEGVITEGDE